jgi:tRNA pseudouridine55 synthase
MGCGAHLTSLRRTAAGPFTLEHALTLERLAEAAAQDRLRDLLPHPRRILPQLPATTADEMTAGRIRNGAAVNLPEFSQAEMVKIFHGRDELIAIGKRIAGTLFQPVAVLL